VEMSREWQQLIVPIAPITADPVHQHHKRSRASMIHSNSRRSLNELRYPCCHLYAHLADRLDCPNKLLHNDAPIGMEN